MAVKKSYCLVTKYNRNIASIHDIIPKKETNGGNETYCPSKQLEEKGSCLICPGRTFESLLVL